VARRGADLRERRQSALARLEKTLDPLSAIVYRVPRCVGFDCPALTLPVQSIVIVSVVPKEFWGVAMLSDLTPPDAITAFAAPLVSFAPRPLTLRARAT